MPECETDSCTAARETLTLHDVALKDGGLSTGLVESGERNVISEELLIIVDVIASNDPVLASY